MVHERFRIRSDKHILLAACEYVHLFLKNKDFLTLITCSGGVSNGAHYKARGGHRILAMRRYEFKVTTTINYFLHF